MDSLTHAAIGACIGELAVGKRLGKHALWLGALAQNLPDMDVVAALWLPFSKNLLVHRGITHSFLFGAVLSFILAIVFSKWGLTKKVGFWPFLLFFLGQIFLHDVLDTCNAYGTGLWLPFSETRFAWHLLYVADPLFSVIPVLVAVALWLKHFSTINHRKVWAAIGLVVPLVYLGYARINKAEVEEQIQVSLASQRLQGHAYFTTPTPFNNWLWYVVAATDSGYHVGYRSVFEEKGVPTQFEYYPKNSHLLANHPDPKEIQDLQQFAAGFYTVQQKQDTLLFNVLRFGQVLGWRQEKADFAFHYYLHPQLDNTLSVQRGRFKGWDWATVKQLFHRIFYPSSGFKSH